MARVEGGKVVTVSCAEGETGRVYEGAMPFEVHAINMAELARPATGRLAIRAPGL